MGEFIMQITRRDSPNRNIGRQGHTPDFIVCHITEGAFDGSVSWALNPDAAVSYHFIVARDGRIVQLVDLANTAWANGTTNGGDSRDNRFSSLSAVRERRVNANLYTISIGFEGIHSERQGGLVPAQFEAGVALTRHIHSEVKRLYNFEIPLQRTNIIGHNELVPRWKPNCPGANFPFEDVIRQLNPPITPPSSDIADWAKEAWQWAIENKITDGTHPTNNITRQETMTLLYRLYKHIEK